MEKQGKSLGLMKQPGPKVERHFFAHFGSKRIPRQGLQLHEQGHRNLHADSKNKQVQF